MKCPKCIKFESENYVKYINHIKKVHKMRAEMPCAMCLKELNTYEGLKKHMKKSNCNAKIPVNIFFFGYNCCSLFQFKCVIYFSSLDTLQRPNFM